MGRHAADGPAPDATSAGRLPSDQAMPAYGDLLKNPAGPLRRGNHESTDDTFEKLIAPHRSGLRDFLLRTAGDENGAECTLRETFYRAAMEPGPVPRRPSAVRAWLILIACSAVQDKERHAPAGHDDRPDELPAKRPTNRFSAPPTALDARQILNGLSAQHREIIVELIHRRSTLQQVADAHDTTVRAVKEQVRNAMKAALRILEGRATGNDRSGGGKQYPPGRA